MNQAYLEFERYIKNKRVDVIGIGVSNTPVIDLLLSMGADVCARDVKPREEKKELAEVLEKKGCGRYLERCIYKISTQISF